MLNIKKIILASFLSISINTAFASDSSSGSEGGELFPSSASEAGSAGSEAYLTGSESDGTEGDPSSESDLEDDGENKPEDGAVITFFDPLTSSKGRIAAFQTAAIFGTAAATCALTFDDLFSDLKLVNSLDIPPYYKVTSALALLPEACKFLSKAALTCKFARTFWKGRVTINANLATYAISAGCLAASSISDTESGGSVEAALNTGMLLPFLSSWF